MSSTDMKVVTLTLNPCVDETLLVSQFGKEPSRREAQTGGKGINVARVLHNFGIECRALAPVNSEEFLLLAKEEGIDLVPVPIAEKTRSITTERRVSDNVQRVVRTKSPEMTDLEIDALRKAVLRELQDTAVFCVCGSACCQKAVRLGCDMLRKAKEMGVKTVLDANTEMLLAGISENPDLIKPNRQELETIAGHSISDENLESEAVKLLQKGIGSVLLTLGEKGAWFLQDGFVSCCPALKVETVNAVGSGDSFLAGFLYAQILGENMFASLRFACACGAANAKEFRAARITLDAVQAIL